jgi:serine phosphatase RsbU (regulator of sigma subunit)
MDNISKLKSIDESYCRLWKGRYENTVANLAEAKSLLKKTEKATYDKGVAYTHLVIAACSFLLSRNDEAQENLSQALQWFSNNTEESGYPCALNLKSNIYESFGDYEKALQYCLEAYKLANSRNDPDILAETSSQLGMIYSRLNNYKKALEFYKEGLKLREEMGDENAAASSLNRIGMIMRMTGEFEESLVYYNKSLSIRQKNNQLTSIPWTLLGLASTYEEMNNYQEAVKIYKKAMIGADRRCILQCMMGLGRIYDKTGKTDLAEQHLNDSLKIAIELNAKSLMAEAYAALAKYYESTGQIKKALESFKLFQSTREAVKSDEAQSRLRNIEISNAIEKSEKEKEIYRLRNVELKEANDIIEEKNHEIISSINYASRIQRAILPKKDEIKYLSEHIFWFYRPKDIVSGDFYWFRKAGRKLVVCAGDCTGHGVPGALMSMLGISFLEEIVTVSNITNPGRILFELRRKVKKALHQRGIEDEAKDGMDIALCVIDKSSHSISYSGANNNLILVRNGELSEYLADRMPIGIIDKIEREFRTNRIKYQPDDIIYMYSDGYVDQFGGPNHKKFKSSGLKALLTQISSFPVEEQLNMLEKNFLDWKGNTTQIDDVLVLGLKL